MKKIGGHYMPLVSARDMLIKAHKEGYGIAQININNLEWIKATLEAVQELQSPVILGVSEGAAKYMGGYRNVMAMVRELIDFLGVTVPVAVHLDHGTYEGAKKALDAGFTSIMFDGSHYPFEENLVKTKEVVAMCHAKGVSVEAEVGSIGGEEDGVVGMGEIADPEECRQIAATGVDMFAAGIGNIHGMYPADWKGLNFDVLAEVQRVTGGVPLVLHGGSGIPDDMVKKAISLGVSKINVNTECQIAFAQATREYIEANLDLKGKGFDPRKLLKPGTEAIKQVIRTKFALFGSVNKA
jgi:fructose-bisphosphate aldolase class II